MRKNPNEKTILLFLLPLFVFLCCLPASTRAAQPSAALPEPTDSCEVAPGTAEDALRAELGLTPDFSLAVFKADGNRRTSGALETGDRAVIRDSSGTIVGCILITVQGKPTPSSAVSPGSSSGASVPDSSSEVPEPASSETSRSDSSEVPGPNSSDTSASSSPKPAENPVFAESRDAADIPRLFASEAANAAVFSPDGLRKESGPVCTGDRIILQDENGTVLRTLNVTVLGDLTHCGKPTESGCTLLYEYLTGHSSLPADVSAAADMNRDGRVDTSDLLKMKVLLLQNPSEPGG